MLVATRAALDTAVLVAPDGRRTLAVLQREYPGAAILREYEAWRLLADGDPREALVRFDGLLRASRRDAALLRGRARALDALGREPDATVAWERVLDGDPDDAQAFEALWRRHQAAASLKALHRTIARLRLLHPADTTLLGREVRVLQALGLADSAAAVVRRFAEGT
jgi:tetratricopeptide (TPR) repeat protein